MNNCQFCHKADDGTVATWYMDAVGEFAEKNGISSAEIFVNDSITVILRTPGMQTDQRMHIDTLYCPMCGRRYGDGE